MKNVVECWKDFLCTAVLSSQICNSVVHVIQGLPSGFDLKYLALADRNIQVRFSLKVVWES